MLLILFIQSEDAIFPEKTFSNQCEQTSRHTHICSYIDQKKTLKGTPPFLCSEFSGVHCTNPTCCRYILQSRHKHCKSTHFFKFLLLKILKDCDNLMSLGTRSHIFGPRNEMDSVPCLTEFILRLCNMSFRRKLCGRETGTNISLKIGGENHARLCKFLLQAVVYFYDKLIRSCFFLIVPKMLKICLYMLFLEPFHVYDLFCY